MDPDVLALAFDRWMDDYIADPTRFEVEWQSVMKHTRDRLDGRAPTYGQEAAQTLLGYCNFARRYGTNQIPPPTPDPCPLPPAP